MARPRRNLQFCLEQTSIIHEAVLERSQRGYCEVDGEGKVVYANDALLKLLPDCVGHWLPGFFGERAQCVAAFFDSEQGTPLRQMEVRHGTKRIPVSAEFGRLPEGAGHGGYAILVDISTFIRAETKAYNASPVGIIKVDTAQTIIFANNRALDIFGVCEDEIVNHKYWFLFPDHESKMSLNKSIKNREQGRGVQFELTYHRRRDDKLIPLRITTMPQFDNLNDDIGALVTIEPLDLEKARRKIHLACERRMTSRKLFEAVLRIIKPNVPFDMATFSIYTNKMDFVRPLHVVPSPRPAWPTLWFPVSAELRTWMLGEQTWNSDMREFLAKQPGAENIVNDPTVMRLIKEGCRSFLCFPLILNGRAIAVLTLLTREIGSFDNRHHAQLADFLTQSKRCVWCSICTTTRRNNSSTGC